jgi:hypothetical protein
MNYGKFPVISQWSPIIELLGGCILKTETRDKLSDPKLLEIRESHFSRLEALYARKSLDYAFVLNGIAGHAPVDPYKETERWFNEALDSLADQSERTMDQVVFRPLVIEFSHYGVHFIDRIFNANVYHHEGQWWADTLKSPVGKLEYPDLDNDDTWQLAERLAKAFISSGVTVPIFGLPTLSSALNIAVNLYNERFFLSMLEEPESAYHDLNVINTLLCDLHRWYLDNIPITQLQPVVAAGRCQPHGYGQLCGCTTHLLSAKTYFELVAPMDDSLLSIYPNGGMIHLCGEHTQHIPAWREMKSLRAIQLNDRASEDLEIYFNELRDDQIIYLNPTADMNVDRAIQITGGHRIVIVADITKPYKLS